jgi:hypothetical protein
MQEENERNKLKTRRRKRENLSDRNGEFFPFSYFICQQKVTNHLNVQETRKTMEKEMN